MKQAILSLVISTSSVLFLTSCKENVTQSTEAQEEVVASKLQLIAAKKDSLTTYKEFKEKMTEKIDVNEAMIANLKLKSISKSKDVKASYDEKIKELEKKNVTLKSKLNDFKEETGKDWELFKAEIKENTDQLEKDFNDLNTNN